MVTVSMVTFSMVTVVTVSKVLKAYRRHRKRRFGIGAYHNYLCQQNRQIWNYPKSEIGLAVSQKIIRDLI
jgi:hypothetical protein